ncbi:MAG: MFS transporter, partial [Chloroflexia bacterium]|nr:MFS transporter [Chloroflexia bacterium]
MSPPGLSREGRLALFWVCLLIAVNQLGFGAIIPAIPLYAQSFGVSASAIGLALGVYGLARFVVNVPAGRFADRRGRKQLLIAGTIATIVGNALCALAPTYPLFLLGRFISGAGAASVLIGGQTIVADISTVANRGRLMAVYQGVFLFAVGVGPLPGGWLATNVGLAAPFAANAILSIGTLAVAAFGIPETRGLRDDAGQRPRQMSL